MSKKLIFIQSALVVLTACGGINQHSPLDVVQEDPAQTPVTPVV